MLHNPNLMLLLLSTNKEPCFGDPNPYSRSKAEALKHSEQESSARLGQLSPDAVLADPSLPSLAGGSQL